MSNIPNHAPQPPLPRSRRVFILALAFSPVVGYTLLKLRQNKIARQRRLEEEEGRKSWIERQNESDTGAGNVEGKLREVGKEAGVGSELDREKDKDLSVNVGRSGGGV